MTYVVQFFLEVAFGQFRHDQTVQRPVSRGDVQKCTSRWYFIGYFIQLAEYVEQGCIPFGQTVLVHHGSFETCNFLLVIDASLSKLHAYIYIIIRLFQPIITNNRKHNNPGKHGSETVR